MKTIFSDTYIRIFKQALKRLKGKYQQISTLLMNKLIFQFNNDNTKVGDKVSILGDEKNKRNYIRGLVGSFK